MSPLPIRTVAMYPRPHPDNICALWLLREFGAERFPGIVEAKIEFWSQVPPGKTPEQWEAEGIMLIDLGGGRFDHHHEEHVEKPTDCATTLVAKELGIAELPELKKLLEYVRRDDLEGRGIVSRDPIDRAFGLSAIVMNLNRDYPDHPEYVIDLVTRVFLAHYHEEYRRKVLMPQEWEQLQQHNQARIFTVDTPQRPLKVAMVETDSKAMVGFLRAVGTVQADVVVQRQSSGHTNIVTKQDRDRLDLRPAVAAIRKAEAEAKGFDHSAMTDEVLQKPRRVEGLDEWYFDTAANTIQNGGAASADVTPTRLSLDTLQHILTETLPKSLADRPSPPPRSQAPGGLRLRDLPPRQERGTSAQG